MIGIEEWIRVGISLRVPFLIVIAEGSTIDPYAPDAPRLLAKILLKRWPARIARATTQLEFLVTSN